MQTPPPNRKLSLSPVLAAFVLLAALDLCLMVAHPLAKATSIGLDRSESFCAMKVMEQEKNEPDVILLGSSTLVAPVVQAEANVCSTGILRMCHRRSTVLQDYLGRHLKSKPEVFSLCSGGQMASDAYYMARQAFEMGKKPRFLIYGIAPRDLHDNFVQAIDSTQAFQCFSRPTDLPQLLQDPQFSIKQKFDLILGRLSALARYRTDIRTFLTLQYKRIVEQSCPHVVFDRYGELMQLKQMRQGHLPEESFERRYFAGEELEYFSVAEMIKSYKSRYNPFSPGQFDTQSAYLEGLLKLCRDNAVPIVIVNMPLSRSNDALMPKGMYALYLHNLQSLCRQYDATCVDMHVDQWANDDNFVDSVHLTSDVSNKFLQSMAHKVVKSRADVAMKRHSDAL